MLKFLWSNFQAVAILDKKLKILIFIFSNVNQIYHILLNIEKVMMAGKISTMNKKLYFLMTFGEKGRFQPKIL